MTGRVKLAGQALALALVAGLLGLLVWKLSHQQHAPKVGSMAPDFTLRRLEHTGAISLSELHGDAVVLNFWASWCGPCKGEASVLQREWNRYRRQGVIFVGVDGKDLASDARTFVSAHGLTFPIVEDGSGEVTGTYGVSQVPETYVLDRTGRIVAHLRGPITSGEFNREFLAALKEVA